jgi:hypothetical protein
MFSATEERVLKILGKKKLTVKVLSEKYFKGQKKPINPSNVISGAIVRINRKCSYFGLDWYVYGEGLGRHGKTVWVCND